MVICICCSNRNAWPWIRTFEAPVVLSSSQLSAVAGIALCYQNTDTVNSVHTTCFNCCSTSSETCIKTRQGSDIVLSYRRTPNRVQALVGTGCSGLQAPEVRNVAIRNIISKLIVFTMYVTFWSNMTGQHIFLHQEKMKEKWKKYRTWSVREIAVGSLCSVLIHLLW